jgi:hypothetical protein
MANSEINSPGGNVGFPFSEEYEMGSGWANFLASVFNKRFAGENFRVCVLPRKKGKYDALAFLVLWHMTEMAYVVEAPSPYRVAKALEDPAWSSAPLVHMVIVDYGSTNKLKVRFELATTK